MKILITGGIKSGKSYQALKVAETLFNNSTTKNFIATAEPFDQDMQNRIKIHKKERQGLNFTTIEETINIDKVATSNSIIDCITMWINNIIYYKKEEKFSQILNNLLNKNHNNLIIVTNEVSMGNIPTNPLTQKYNSLLAKSNRILAQKCDVVILMVSGIPVFIKGEL